MKKTIDIPFALIKFGSHKNMLKLMNDGELRFSLSKEYNDLINEKQRGDLYEGAEKIINSQVLKIETKHPTLGNYAFKPVVGKLSKLMQFNYYYLTYSLYSISPRNFIDKNEHKIDKEHLKFGDTAIFITKPLEFLNAITSQLKKEKLEYEMNFIEYLNYEKEGEIEINPFNKKSEHSHQMEFRIIIKNINNTPQFLRIGSIAKYASLVTSQSMIETDWLAKRK